MTDQPQRHRRWVLASRPMVNRRQRISARKERSADAGAGSSAAAYCLFIARPVYARAHERRAVLFAAGGHWRGDGGRDRESRGQLKSCRLSTRRLGAGLQRLAGL